MVTCFRPWSALGLVICACSLTARAASDFTREDELVRTEFARVANPDPLRHVPPRANLVHLALPREFLLACLEGRRVCPGLETRIDGEARHAYLLAWRARKDADVFEVLVRTESPTSLAQLTPWLEPTQLDALVKAVGTSPAALPVARELVYRIGNVSRPVGQWVFDRLEPTWSPVLVEHSGAQLLRIAPAVTTERLCRDLLTTVGSPSELAAHQARVLKLLAEGTRVSKACRDRIVELIAVEQFDVVWAARAAALVHAPRRALRYVAAAVERAQPGYEHTAAFQLALTAARFATDPAVRTWVARLATDPAFSAGEREALSSTLCRFARPHSPCTPR